MNREYSFDIVKSLLQWGVAEFYICAGARNFPLVETVLGIRSKEKIVFNHFEERSAAFYALGRIKQLKKPVAVITTSGTAVGELLPAVMEAYYSGLPLVLITGDRPRSYRGTGAPQTAEQKNIFGSYVSKCIDLQHPDTLEGVNEIDTLSKQRPLHINVCFDVPLQSGTLNPIAFVNKINKKNAKKNDDTNHQKNVFKKKQEFEDFEKLHAFLKKSNNLFVIISQIVEDNKSNLIKFLKKLNCPIYFESTSNLRGYTALSHLKISSADAIWINAEKSHFKIDSVLKIGGTPTHRVWRDLDETCKDIRVFSIGELPFSGMPHTKHVTTHLNEFFGEFLRCHIATQTTDSLFNHMNSAIKIQNNQTIEKFLDFDKKSYSKLNILFQKYPNSEQSFFYHLSKIIGRNETNCKKDTICKHARVFLGNSMPIRYWDLVACNESSNQNLIIDASRGLNGIDGQISTFLGFASETQNKNWGIFGDLTTLYDLAGPWMLQQRPNLNVTIVIINNSGGRIFQRVLKGEHAELCQNTHNLEFQSFAKMWGLKYKKITSIHQIKKIKNLRMTERQVLEIIPNLKQTQNFNKNS